MITHEELKRIHNALHTDVRIINVQGINYQISGEDSILNNNNFKRVIIQDVVFTQHKLNVESRYNNLVLKHPHLKITWVKLPGQKARIICINDTIFSNSNEVTEYLDKIKINKKFGF